MTKSYVFQPPLSNSVDDMVNTFELKKLLSNSRTTIFQNSEMRFCVDAKVVRVTLFNEENTQLLERLREYFYGEEYTA